MKIALRIGCAAGTLAAVSFGWMVWAGSSGREVRAQDKAAPSAAGVAVEDDMHEFMEYAFQPAYQRLQKQMAAAPTDNAGWKVIKAEALVLAEGGNLLLLRLPPDDADAWKTHSTQVRDLGGQLYRAGKNKDFAAARKHYEAMLSKCNACHTQFADGEHQLEP